jgi:hypothetical protein
MITASCGHEITIEWDSNPKSFIKYKDNETTIVYAVVCEKCREKYKKLGILIE